MHPAACFERNKTMLMPRSVASFGVLGFYIGVYFAAAMVGRAGVQVDPESVSLAKPSGTTTEELAIIHWQSEIISKPTGASGWERLAWAYVDLARRTQDAGYYKLGELTADAWEKRCGPSQDIQLLRGHVFHNLHRFREAEAVARVLTKERGTPADFALLSDALMEQGKLEEAVEACQRLVNLKPGIEAYTRIAQLRWLNGDVPGAVAALEDGIRCTDTRKTEVRAWLYTRLSWYELLQGKAPQALARARIALEAVPEYPLALTAEGKALFALGLKSQAVDAFRRAVDLNPIPENLWWYSDTLTRAGNSAQAKLEDAKLMRSGAASDQRTFALYLATRGKLLDEAEELAHAELNNRGDCFTHDAYAFALLQRGHNAAAQTETAAALSHGTPDPRLFLHAGLVAEAAGYPQSAQQSFLRAKPMAALLTPSEQDVLAAHLSGPAVASAQ